MGSSAGPSTGVSFQYQNVYRLTVSLSDNRTWTIIPESDLPVHKWNHVTISWHEAWGLKYYVNGAYKDGTNKWVRDLDTNFTVASRIVIGGGESAVGGASSIGSNMQISDLRVWQRYLSPTHVVARYKKPVWPKSEWYLWKNSNSSKDVQTIWQPLAGCTESQGTGGCSELTWPAHCSLPLGLESGFVPNVNFTSSSDYGPSNASYNARLNSELSYPITRAWSSQINDINQWVGVEIGEAVKVTGIATQGLYGSRNWVESFTLSHSNNGVNFTALNLNFTGNSDDNTVVTNYLEGITARYIRVHPTKWNNHISMRIELYGCTPVYDAMFLESSSPRVKGDKARLEGPYVTPAHNCLKFDYKMTGADVGRLNVYTRTYDGQESLVWRLAGDQNSNFKSAAIPFTNINHPYKMILEGVVGDSFLGDILIQNVAIEEDDCTFQPVKSRPKDAGFQSGIMADTPTFQSSLATWLRSVGYEGKYWAPCYRAIHDGWSDEIFHAKCDNKGPFVVIFREDSNSLVGGFSDRALTKNNEQRFIPSTRTFLFSAEWLSITKWGLKPRVRYEAIRPLTNTGPWFGSGDFQLILSSRKGISRENTSYEMPVGTLPAEFSLLDVEVLILEDSVCNPPCLQWQICDEIIKRCTCDTYRRDVKRCRGRNDAPSSQFWNLLQNRPIMYWPMNDVKDARLIDKEHGASAWPKCGGRLKCWTNNTVGVNEGGLYSDGTSTGNMTIAERYHCFSVPQDCNQGLMLALWLKHEIKSGIGQTFFSTGAPGENRTGFRAFQFKDVTADHMVLQLVTDTSNCVRTYHVPQKIWSHFVVSLGPNANSFQLYLNGEVRHPFSTTCTSGNFQNGPNGIWIGDQVSGFPNASYDDVILLQNSLSSSEIRNLFQFYHGEQFHVNMTFRTPEWTWHSDLLDSETEMYKTKSAELTSELKSLLNPSDVLSVKLVNFQPGSVISKLSVEFIQTNGEVLDSLVNRTHQMKAEVLNISVGEVYLSDTEISAANLTSSTSINITWGLPRPTTSIFHGYAIYYRLTLKQARDRKVAHTAYDLYELKSLSVWSLYTLYVRPLTLNGEGKKSNEVVAWTQSVAPTNLTSVSATTSSITVAWQPIPSLYIKNYTVFYKRTGFNDTIRNVSVDASVSTVTLPGLESFRFYDIQVAGYVYKLGPKSEMINATTERENIPLVPCNVTASIASITSLYVKWDAIKFRPLDGYWVWCKEVDTGMLVKKVKINTTSTKFTYLTGLTEFTNYSIEVAGYNAWEVGPKTVQIYKTIEQVAPEVAPGNITVYSKSSSSIQLCWDPVHFPTPGGGYKISYQGGGNASHDKIVYKNITSTELTGLQANVNHTIKIAGVAGWQTGPFSELVSRVTTDDDAGRPPRNFTAFTTSNQTIHVCWEKNPFKLVDRLVVHYSTDGPGASALNVTLTPNETRTRLSDLALGGSYNVSIVGETICGFGRTSASIHVINNGEDPTRAPNITAHNTSSTSLLVQWSKIPSALVRGYRVMHREVGSNSEPINQTVDHATWSVNLTNLKKFSNYSVQLQTFVWCLDGPISSPIYVMTDEDIPSHPPVNVSARNTSSTSLRYDWGEVPLLNQHGIILGYQVTYWKNDSLSSNVSLITSNLTTEVFGLEKFTWYTMVMAAFTIKGLGNFSQPITERTDEDVPTKPPVNATAKNDTDTHRLPVLWKPIPQKFIHGFLLGYKITYQAIMTGDEHVKGLPVLSVTVPPWSHSVELVGLDSYTVYRVQIWGYTRIGDGPKTTIYGETCRCQEVFSTYWVDVPPYVNFTVNATTNRGEIGGLIPHFLTKMVDTCCETCAEHGRSYLNFDEHNFFLDRKSFHALSVNIQEVDFSFPVHGTKYQNRYGKDFLYLGLIDSPGVIHIVNPKGDLALRSVMNSAFGSWPLFLITFTLAFLAGLLVWVSEFRDNSEQFSPFFVRGSGSGFWWAFISMTTVGYGDLAPATKMGRIVSVAWILIGLVIYGLLSSTICTTLTVVSVLGGQEFKLFGAQVAVIENSPEHRLAIRRNANVTEKGIFQSFDEVVETLKKGPLKQGLLEAYMAGSKSEQFINSSLKVQEVIDYSSTYGAVVGGNATKLQKCFGLYTQLHVEEWFRQIQVNTDFIKNRGKTGTKEESSGILDPTHPLFNNLLFYCGIILSVAFVLGSIWEVIYRLGRRPKKNVGPSDNVSISVGSACEDVRELLEEFRQNTFQMIEQMKAKHKTEIRYLRKMKGAR